jgi:hypothetical protein
MWALKWWFNAAAETGNTEWLTNNLRMTRPNSFRRLICRSTEDAGIWDAGCKKM